MIKLFSKFIIFFTVYAITAKNPIRLPNNIAGTQNNCFINSTMNALNRLGPFTRFITNIVTDDDYLQSLRDAFEIMQKDSGERLLDLSPFINRTRIALQLNPIKLGSEVKFLELILKSIPIVAADALFGIKTSTYINGKLQTSAVYQKMDHVLSLDSDIASRANCAKLCTFNDLLRAAFKENNILYRKFITLPECLIIAFDFDNIKVPLIPLDNFCLNEYADIEKADFSVNNLYFLQAIVLGNENHSIAILINRDNKNKITSLYMVDDDKYTQMDKQDRSDLIFKGLYKGYYPTLLFYQKLGTKTVMSEVIRDYLESLAECLQALSISS